MFLRVPFYICICWTNKYILGNSLIVQWLELSAFIDMGRSSIPGQGTKILQATWHYQKIKKNKKNFRVLWYKKIIVHNYISNQWQREWMGIVREVNLKFCIINSIVFVTICKIRYSSIISYRSALWLLLKKYFIEV